MADNRLMDALNDSLDRLANGQTIQDCLNAYPDLADELYPMLLTGQVVRRARADAAELGGMYVRVSADLDRVIADTQFPARHNFDWLQMVAVFALVVFFGFIALAVWQRDTLFPASTPEPTPTLAPLTITPTATLTSTPTLTPSLTETPTSTPSPEPTATRDAGVVTDEATTLEEEPGTTPGDSLQQLVAPTQTSVACDAPDEWVPYQIQPGDTLSSVAVRSGSTVDELALVNCIEDPRLLVVGAILLVPREPDALEGVGSTSGDGTLRGSSGSGSGSSGSGSNSGPSGDDFADDDDDDRSGSNSGSDSDDDDSDDSSDDSDDSDDSSSDDD